MRWRGLLRVAALATFLAAGEAIAAEAEWSSEAIAKRLKLPTGKIEMVLDSDMCNEVDDQFALAYAVRSEDRITLRAVYAAPFQNHRSTSAEDGMEKSYQETFRVLKLLGKPSDGLVFRGSAGFLKDHRTPIDSPAARHLVQLAKEKRDAPLYVVGLGAASNIASALLMDPSLAQKIVVVWIGGHPYSWPHARDFNLKQDVAAAQVLFDSEVPLVHVPAGDVAATLKITLPELDAGLKGKSPIADNLLAIVDGYYTETKADKKFTRSGPNAWQKVIWDIATIAWLLDPEGMAPSNVVPAPVLTDAGTWQKQDGRHPVRVVVRLDRDRIFRDVFEKLGR